MSLELINLEAGPVTGQSRAIVWLWGEDRNLADASATLIERYTLTIEPAGRVMVLLPDRPHERIDQGLGPVEIDEATFHFSIFVDVDGDGALCPGDLRQDFVASHLAFFAALPASLRIALTPISSSDACMPTTP